MAENHPYVGMLVDMGFLKNDAIKAISNLGETNADNIDNIIEEIGRIQDAMSVDESSETKQGEQKTEEAPKSESQPQSTEKSRADVLQAQLEKSKQDQEKLKQKNLEIEARAEKARQARIEKEKQEKIAAEKHRRNQGTKMQSDRRDFEDQEMKKLQQKIESLHYLLIYFKRDFFSNIYVFDSC